MKTILVLTDFSDNARHAAEYALELAKKTKADLLLCNTFMVPADISMTGFSMWPQEEYTVLSDESDRELNLLKKHLQDQPDMNQEITSFYPNIDISRVDGNIGDVVKERKPGTIIQLVVAGTHDKDGLSSFLLGNNVNNMIDNIGFPLLLIPANAAFNTDEKALYKLVELAKPLNAEILVTHIYNEKNDKLDFEKQIKALLTAISNKANYANIYSRIVDEEKPEKGLHWLCKNGQVDMLAMVHQKHNLFQEIFGSSHTKNMAERISIPLLVLPN
jgi:nucleotide-binding universal stress UspA family protein